MELKLADTSRATGPSWSSWLSAAETTRVLVCTNLLCLTLTSKHLASLSEVLPSKGSTPTQSLSEGGEVSAPAASSDCSGGIVMLAPQRTSCFWSSDESSKTGYGESVSPVDDRHKEAVSVSCVDKMLSATGSDVPAAVSDTEVEMCTR